MAVHIFRWYLNTACPEMEMPAAVWHVSYMFDCPGEHVSWRCFACAKIWEDKGSRDSEGRGFRSHSYLKHWPAMFVSAILLLDLSIISLPAPTSILCCKNFSLRESSLGNFDSKGRIQKLPVLLALHSVLWVTMWNTNIFRYRHSFAWLSPRAKRQGQL